MSFSIDIPVLIELSESKLTENKPKIITQLKITLKLLLVYQWNLFYVLQNIILINLKSFIKIAQQIKKLFIMKQTK